MKDKKAIKHLNKLGKYCIDRVLCEGCVFRNVYITHKCPIAQALELTTDLRNEADEQRYREEKNVTQNPPKPRKR